MLRVLCGFVMLATIASCVEVSAHDLERTQVSIVFARDGSFILDVSNDPAWLALRLDSIPGSFIDRVVLFVDGREIRPSSVELIRTATVAIHRMRGRMPADAHTLRWYYGLVGDPYPLTIHRADGRLVVEEVAGDAWSRTIDLSGQFKAPLMSEGFALTLVLGLLLAPVTIRLASAIARKKSSPLVSFGSSVSNQR